MAKKMDEALRMRILKEAKKRYTYMTVIQIHESKTHYEVEYVKQLGGKEYVARIHKDLVEE